MINQPCSITKFLLAALVVGFGFSESSHAQLVEAITFSRPPSEVAVSAVEFVFEDVDTEVQIDQLGTSYALYQNNDTFGEDFGIVVAGPVDSIGQVFAGDVIAPDTDFGNTDLLVDDFIAPGENFFLGFSSGSDVGYFNIAWDAGPDGSIHYSAGQFASGGASLTVSAVPEPSAIALISVLSMLTFTRRRRG
ncbi:PEP-CTERM sorting domain-containing protein [Mariniblastus fucicola]|uniref:PEP-CTERM protein-sorting domain-containing protein n=1 Tax=Mariniblastus fucicola TaxID=980251 RepID=A0A5B9PIK7_9BACT|nr:PEP-CTERM sorting domain-containing protein [Mariniblastus fucicola]QEG24502.1 hypothetical protein MFFC18_44220 [Mariniblastus fucicola]